MLRRASCGLAVLAAVACGGAASPSPSPAIDVAPAPAWQRAATAGDALLPLLPPGAEILVELDLARARGNPALGPALAEGLPAASRMELPAPLAAQRASGELLARLDALVLASYKVGTADAQTLTLIALAPGREAQALAASLGAVALDDRVVAVGPPALVALAGARAGAAEIAVTKELLELRARAMPAAASGAVLRAAALLSVEARLSLARHAALDPPPATLSAWLDLADDAALVAWLSAGAGEDARSLSRLAAAARGALAELAEDPKIAALGLSPALTSAALTTHEGWLRVTLVVGPARLRRVGARALAAARAAASPPQEGAPP